MKYISAIALVITICSSSSHQNSTLLGKWKSDKELTLMHIQHVNGLNAEQKAAQQNVTRLIGGRMTLEFSNDQLIRDFPELNIFTHGKTYNLTKVEQASPINY